MSAPCATRAARDVHHNTRDAPACAAIAAGRPACAAIAAGRRAPRAPANGRHASANGRHASVQYEFDWEFADNRTLLFVEEIAERFAVTDETVRLWVEEGRVMGFAINHDDAPHREHLRIVRATVNTDLTAVTVTDWRRLVATIDQWLFKTSRPALQPREVGSALRICGNQVKALYEAGHLRAATIGTLTADRRHLRFARASVTEFVRRRIEARGFVPIARL